MTEPWNAEEKDALRALAAEEPAPFGAEEATVAALRREGLLRRPRARVVLAAAAGLALFASGALVQQRAGFLSAPPDGRPRFLLLLYADGSAAVASKEPTGTRIREYRAWAEHLSEAGHLVEAEKLAPAAYSLGGPAEPEAGDDVLSGFFLIAASDLAEAKILASRSPHLRHGGRVVVRPVERTSNSR